MHWKNIATKSEKESKGSGWQKNYINKILRIVIYSHGPMVLLVTIREEEDDCTVCVYWIAPKWIIYT